MSQLRTEKQQLEDRAHQRELAVQELEEELLCRDAERKKLQAEALERTNTVTTLQVGLLLLI